MKKIIQFFKKLYIKFWLKKNGINPVELIHGVHSQNFLDKNPRSTFSLSKYIEVVYETI